VKAISNIAPAWEIGFDAFGYSALKIEIYLVFDFCLLLFLFSLLRQKK